MRVSGRAGAGVAGAIAAVLVAAPSGAMNADQQAILDRLLALEERQKALETQLAERDARIRELESRGVGRVVVVDDLDTVAESSGDQSQAVDMASSTQRDQGHFGRFQPGGTGYRIADTPNGTVNFGAWSYVRYLNQLGLDDSYTDSFGREFDIDTRNDIQVNKVNLTFHGWLFEPDFRWLLYTWTANTSQGDSAQVVVAGNLKYRVNEALDLGFGIEALPGTMTTSGSFPYWNKVDYRTMADEFFRPSYTSGIWAQGAIADDLRYKLMLGNNLSQLGVNAAQLDDSLDTWSGRIDWMPTTGEFGRGDGFGDFEVHEEMATRFGIAGTYSREDRQSQPGTDDIENAQIRLSDGTLLFRPGAFATDGRVNNATYRMVSALAGMKYQGFSLVGEYFWRWVDEFKEEGELPVDDLFDHGYQLQTSWMFLPRTLEGYVAASKIFGEYGEPWDTAMGLNWYPMRERLLRVNGELVYLNKSAVGYSSMPYQVGGDGVLLHTNLEMKF